MADYRAPTRDIAFVIQELLDAEAIRSLPGYEEFEPDTVNAILDEAGRFAGEVLAPLNHSGDRTGARWNDGEVAVPDGFREAYQQYVEAGYNALTGDPDFGGMGMPRLLGAATHELWNAANMSFALCPLLTASAVDLLAHHGSDDQRRLYLPKLVSGEWTGTMDLTEPQAGSDLGVIRTKAVPADDGSYRLFGQKIYITWGEHEAAENIVHLVLARLPDAPAGVKGISLFAVPKYLVNENGNPGARNDMRCASIEEKLGIHASPTCTMTYGDGDGAVGYLVGEPNQGLACMFTMMNAARHKMGVQGLGVADRAYQQALAYARDRVQGQPPGTSETTIVHHPDVKRMLMTMRSQIEVMRGLCYEAAAEMDVAAVHPDERRRAAAQARVDLSIPIVKAWCTEVAVELASLGIQVHGGMGFVEETGAAQYLRDVRIAPIYEGTNGIQANDLVGRKLLRDEGRAMSALLADMDATCHELHDTGDGKLGALATALADAVRLLREATDTLLGAGARDRAAPLANAFNYLMLAGYVCGGWYAARMAHVANQALDDGTPETDFYEGKLAAARFYCDQVLPRAHAYGRPVLGDADAVLGIDPARHL